MQTDTINRQFGEFPYLHGFSPQEQARLARQARFLESEVYRDIDLARCCHLLEVGCGVGAQTDILLRRFPGLQITGVDFSQAQLARARARLLENPLAEGRVVLQQMDAADLDFAAGQFDAAFLCWILEHVATPAQVLAEVRRVLQPGAPVFVTEVMNASFFVSPYSPHLQQYWLAFNDHQLALGGDPFIGVKLGQMLLRQGFRDVHTEVKTWHLDARDPRRRHEVLLYWCELLQSAAPQLLAAGRVSEALVAGMRAELASLEKDPELVLFYSFCQARARA